MIYGPFSHATRSADKRLAAGAVLTALGCALVYGMEAGKQVVTPSTGAAGELFAGFSWAQTSAVPVAPNTAVRVETQVVPPSGIISVARAPLAGTTAAINTATGAAVAVVSVTGKDVDLAVASAGLTVKVTYRFTLTAAESRSLVGDVQPGGYSGNTYGQVGVNQQGVIFTDQFNTAENFAAPGQALYLSSGGLITTTAGGTQLNAVVVQVPSTDYPFLGIQFSAI